MQIAIVDAVGRPVPNPTVDAGGAAAAGPNATFDLGERESPVTIRANSPGFHEITLTVWPRDGSWLWDDPGARLASGNPSMLVIPLPTVRAARLVDRSEDELTFVPGRIPTRPPGAIRAPDGRYRGLFDGAYRFHIAGRAFLGDAASDGWRRFDDSVRASVDPSTRGQFVFLEWGGLAGMPRLFLGAWLPKPESALESRRDDEAVVYFTPNTAAYPADQPPYTGEYPYGLTHDEKSWDQPYLGLVRRHLFNEKWLAYQLLAAERAVLLLCPVQPAGLWKAFSTRSGLGRLVAEVLLWARRSLLPRAGPLAREPSPDPQFSRSPLGAWPAPPRVGTVVTCGFSAGVGAIKNLIATPAVPQGFPGAIFGAPEYDFSRAWKEIWDFDAPISVTGGVDAWARTLREWRRDSRVVRIYHTPHTGWQLSDLNRLDSLLPQAPIHHAAHAARGAAIRSHCTLGSAAVMNIQYLTGGGADSTWQQEPGPNRPPDRPDFWNVHGQGHSDKAHQIVPIVSAGHAAALSTLTKSRP